MDKPISVADYVAIQNILGKYQWLVDEGDADGWASLFTEDGVFASAFLTDHPTGHAQLKATVKETERMFGDRMRHLMGSCFMEYGATTDHVHVKYYSLVTTWKKDEGPRFFCFALYTTDLVQRDDGWKITRAATQVL